MKPMYATMTGCDYTYVCNGKTIVLRDDQTTIVEHKKYFCVVCTDCCNVPVLHLLNRKGD
jgi:hypothetical protein